MRLNMVGRVRLCLWVFVAMGVGGQAVWADAPPHVVFVTGDCEYKSEISMPWLARELEAHHGMRTTVLYADPTPQTLTNLPGLDALDDADLAVIFIRFRALPEEQLKHILKYVESGKPVVAFRTTTHAFRYPKESPFAHLNDGFGTDLIGVPWLHHYGHSSSTDARINPDKAAHPLLKGVAPLFHVRSWLYHVVPLPEDCDLLMTGTSVDPGRGRIEERTQNPVAWTRVNRGGRTFYTSMGHPSDFDVPSMRRLAVNAVYWALGRDVPDVMPNLPPAKPLLKLKTDDRVLFLGNTFIERSYHHGHIESMLTRAFPDRKAIFRNMGWAGDTVHTQNRPLNFGTIAEHVDRFKPTVAFTGYGLGEAMEEETSVEAFVEGYAAILDTLEKHTDRIVMISPIRLENLGEPFPDQGAHNAKLAEIVEASRALASTRGHVFVDLYNLLDFSLVAADLRVGRSMKKTADSEVGRYGVRAGKRWTDNGIHLTDAGYRRAAQVIAMVLGIEPAGVVVHVDGATGTADTAGAEINNLHADATHGHWSLKLDRLAEAAAGDELSQTTDATTGRLYKIRVTHLEPGQYQLRIDGQTIGVADEQAWASGITIASGPDIEQSDLMRAKIRDKSRLFFYRWRAHNGA